MWSLCLICVHVYFSRTMNEYEQMLLTKQSEQADPSRVLGSLAEPFLFSTCARILVWPNPKYVYI